MVYITLLGMVLGSFIGLAVVRIPRHESLWWPRSHCRDCGHVLAWYENIPLFSYLILRGRCRQCKSPIAFRYWLIEFSMTLITVGAYLLIVPWTRFLMWEFAFVLPMVLLLFLDWKEKILPITITAPGIALGFLSHWVEGRYFPPGPLEVSTTSLLLESLWGFLAGGLTLFLVAEIYQRAKGKVGMGGGDIWLGAMIGAFFGWKAVFFIFFLASVSGTCFGVTMILLKRHNRQTRLPFGSFLAAAALLFLFYGEPLLHAYLTLFKFNK